MSAIRRFPDGLSVPDFLRHFLDTNTPVVFAYDISQWRITKLWVTGNGDDDQEIDWGYVCREHGKEEVPVKSGLTCTTMTLAEYRDKPWHSLEQPKPYLKDWHACLSLKGEQLYEPPPHFEDDWLNDWLTRTKKDSDYKFVYLGPAGSRTDVHTDVLHSNSWSAQIAGQKRWLLLHPSHRHLVEDANGICCVAQFSEAVEKLCVEVVQSPGEVIFVPAGWYHSVDNLSDSLSVNHNWIDSVSLERSWHHLLKEYRIAEHYIEDCRALVSTEEFAALVDRNAKLQSGMNTSDFFDMINAVMTIQNDDELQCRRLKYGRAFLSKYQQYNP